MASKLPDEAPLSLTEGAKAEISRIRKSQPVPEDHFLRVGMRGGGCSGMSYLLGFDTQKPEDKVYFVDGIKILIDQRHGMYVLGMEIEYFQEGEQAGFVFNNPNERQEEGFTA